MYNSIFFLKISVLFLIILVSCSHSRQINYYMPDPKIEMGVARISGKVLYIDKNLKQKPQILFLGVLNVIRAEEAVGLDRFEIPLNEDDNFAFEIPISNSPNLAWINLNMEQSPSLINLSSNEETTLEIILHEDSYMEVKVISGPNFFFVGSKEMEHVNQLISDMALYSSDNSDISQDSINRFVANPKEYVSYFIKSSLNPRLEMMEKDSILSDKTRAFQLNTFKLAMYRMCLVRDSFSEEMGRLYEVTQTEGDTTTFEKPEEPDKSYYSFLKGLDLNNPQQLYNFHYPLLCQHILSNETLSLPTIEEMPIDEWMKQTKKILAELVGFDKGQFYDVLLGNAYSKQFIDEMRPLSDRQIQNIKNYYKGGEVEKILLRENERIKELNHNRFETVINVTPDIENEKLMETIISKYRGKVIVVDFWATWCAPCLAAMSESRKMKSKMKDKDIVFIYITNVSSPKGTWDAKVKGIGGEHYYLTQEEWEYLMNTFGIDAIPAYQFYDKKGQLQKQITGFSNVEMIQNIEELLLE